MSHSIPQVRRWRVNYWKGADLYRAEYASAPTKQFAKWNARDKLRGAGDWFDVYTQCDRITVTVVSKTSRYA